MARTIKFTVTVRKNGVLTDLTSAVLSDSTGLFAVKRMDTGAVVLDTTIARTMTRDAAGRYSYTIPNVVVLTIDLGVVYRAFPKLTYDNGDVSYRIIDGIAAVGSSYIDYDKFIRKWTNKALIEVTDKEHVGLTSPDDDLINDAFVWAEAWINMLIGGGQYTTPLEFTGSVDPVVEEWAMVLAFARLYYDRWDDSTGSDEVDGQQQQNQTAKKIKNRVGQVIDEIALIRSGIGPTLTGATLSTEYSLMPSLLSPRDVWDANWHLLFAGARPNVW